MSWQQFFHRMLTCNRGTGFAIYYLLMEHYRWNPHGFITPETVTRISLFLHVSERWIYHILNKYGLFIHTEEGYVPVEGWDETDVIYE